MRALTSLCLLLLAATPALGAKSELREVRVLVLDAYGEDLPALELKLLENAVFDALRGRPGLLIARTKQIRAEAPLVADRIDGCDEELCLYEAGEAIRAEFVIFVTARVDDAGRHVRIGVFETAAGEIVRDERVDDESIAAALPALEGAMDRVLVPVMAGTRPNPFERPAFMTGAGLVFIGSMATLGGLGWAGEMETALADPERHRDQKQFALDNGHRALWLAGFGAGTTLVGAGILYWAVQE